MIEIDKSDFLYRHLSLLGEEDVDKKYLEYASLGIATSQDFKKELYNFFGECYNNELDEEELSLLIPYFNEVKKLKTLSSSKFNKLLKSYKQDKDKNIFKQLINAKLKDVILLAYMYKLKNDKIELMDIVQICNLGLIKAIDKYNENSKINFDEYMYYWIKEEINGTKENIDGQN